MRKNLLALSIAAMVGGLTGVANAQVQSTTSGGIELISFDAPPASSPDPAVINTWVVGPLDETLAAAAAGNKPKLAVAAGGLAQNLTLQSQGIGHVLVVPYFTTQGQNHTLLNIVNTDTVNGKAVKLRYRGAANSDDVFDITVYLSPGDVWSADVSVDAEGFSRLETSDNSCTLPSKQEIKDAFNGRFKTGRLDAGNKDGTREGYIEILNTADIRPTRWGFVGENPLYTAIKHVNGVAPCTQSVMAAQENPLVAVPGSPNSPRVRGYSWPTGGLMANWAIVDMSKTASFSGEALAVRAERGGFNAAGRLVWAPQTESMVDYTSAVNLTADPLFRNNVVKAQSQDFPDLSTPYIETATLAAPTGNGAPSKFPLVQARTLSAALATTNVINEYLTDAKIGFETDWVFSMPTRRYAVAVNYGGTGSLSWNTAAASVVNGLWINGGNPAAAGDTWVDNNFFSAANVDYVAEGKRACAYAAGIQAFDREEVSRNSFTISPAPAFRFCGEASVLTFNKGTAAGVLSAQIARQNIDTKMVEGWMRINTPGLMGRGLPVVGFSAAKANGNIGGTWAHRTLRP